MLFCTGRFPLTPLSEFPKPPLSTNGATYIANVPGGGIQPGQTTQVVVSFVDPTRVPFRPVVTAVIPGPGPVVQGTVNAAAGGTIAVTDAGDPLLGTEVTIPPGALGDPSDTITIGYANALPGALNSNATSAGVLQVSKVVVLARQGTTPFKKAVTVTIPYSAASLGTADFPAVLYWDSSLNQYQPVAVTSVDNVNGLVTFVAKHFTSYVAVGIPGLIAMLQAERAAPALVLQGDTKFRPETDGFEIQNFTSRLSTITGDGVCYGLTSYAAWYFTAKPGTSRLFDQYKTSSDSGVVHTPQEDAVARELVAETFIDTAGDNAMTTHGASGSALSISQLEINLIIENAPQLVTVKGYDAKGKLFVHSVLVYRWIASGTTISFDIYDPNYPGITVPPLLWSPSGFQPYSYVDDQGAFSLTFFGFDAISSHYDPAVLAILFASTQTGPPKDYFGAAWHFNNVTFSSPLGSSGNQYPGNQSGPQLNADPVKGTLVNVNWTCADCPTIDTATGNPITYYLHVFQNGFAVSPIPTVIAPSGSATLQTLPFGSSAELLAFVSEYPIDDATQFNISFGYAGFQRAELLPVAQTYTPTWTMFVVHRHFVGAVGAALNIYWAMQLIEDTEHPGHYACFELSPNDFTSGGTDPCPFPFYSGDTRDPQSGELGAVLITDVLPLTITSSPKANGGDAIQITMDPSTGLNGTYRGSDEADAWVSTPCGNPSQPLGTSWAECDAEVASLRAGGSM